MNISVIQRMLQLHLNVTSWIVMELNGILFPKVCLSKNWLNSIWHKPCGIRSCKAFSFLANMVVLFMLYLILSF